MKNSKLKLTVAGLAVALATAAATTAKADVIVTFNWVQGTTGGSASSDSVVLADSTETSSGTLIYDETTHTVTSYSFSVTAKSGGTYTFTDTSLNPTTAIGVILADGDLHLGDPPGEVVSEGSTAYWLDGDVYGPQDENRLVLPQQNGVSPSITGDWIPATVPEASTVVAGSLLLLPFGLGALRAIRKDRVNGLA
jgi:hypothetical protein